MSGQRYILEGEWTGYVERQRRVVHREVVTGKRVERLQGLHSIVYTDGTCLILRLREAEPRERVKEIHSYDDLIRECEREPGNRVRVADLPSTQRASA